MKKMCMALMIMYFSLPSICKAELSEAKINNVFKLAELSYGNALQSLNGKLKYPRSIDKNGNWTINDARDWTSGFFPGILWLLYENNGEEKWKIAAKKYTDGLETEKNFSGDHDIGFRIMCSFGNGYRLTNDMHYQQVIIDAGKTFSKRYNSKVKATKSWDWGKEQWQYPVIIDNLMNLELLFKAYSLTQDRDFQDIAINHASLAAMDHIRSDGGSYHVVDYNPETGQKIQRLTHQGLYNESTWSRGQAWGIYGFTIAYQKTSNPIFLEAALKLLSYDMLHNSDDLVPYWDYNLTNPNDGDKDSSAAAIKAAGLLELSNSPGLTKIMKNRIKNYAEQTLESLINEYLVENEKGGILTHVIGNYPAGSEVNVSITYADYYFLKALLILKQQRQ